MSGSLKKDLLQTRATKKSRRFNAANDKSVIKTWSRVHNLPSFVGHTIAVHDGRKHVPVYVIREI